MVASKNNKENQANKNKGLLNHIINGKSKNKADKGGQSNTVVNESDEPSTKKNEKTMTQVTKKIKVDEPQYPNLVPICSDKYNWSRAILSELYVKELSHSIYHLWLDCLYEENINLDSIYDGLRPLLGAHTKKLPSRSIFLSVIKSSELPAGKPDGSCFVVLPNCISKDFPDFEAKIASQRIHMKKINIAFFRDHVKDNQVAVFSCGYKDLVSKLSPKTIGAIFSNAKQIKQNQKAEGDQQILREHLERLNEPKDHPKPIECLSNDSGQDPSDLKEACENRKLVQKRKQEEQKQQEKSVQKKQNKKLDSLCKELVKEKLGRQAKRDQRSSSPEIIQEITSAQKKAMAQVPTKIQTEESIYKLEFIPVTEESLNATLKLMKMFESEKRGVAIVFDPCFLLDKIDLQTIRDKFQPIFGNIRPNQVLIRNDAKKLAKNLEEAYKSGVKNLNHAYIVGDLGMTDNDINRKAAARGTFCCPMTLGCVMKNLERGIYLMHRSVIFHPCEYRLRDFPSPPSISASKSISKDPEKNDTSPKSDKQKTNSASKRNCFAASLNGEEHKSDESFTSVAKTESQIQVTDPDLWNRISKCGNSVIKIENLPAKLTLDALRLMMGTFTLKSDQIVAANQTETGRPDLMDVRIVLDANKPDAKSVLAKNNCKTIYNTRLVIERTHHGELKKFMRKHASHLRRLNTNDLLPLNNIGYAPNNNL